ncbi:MAG: hypothetical protein GWP17_05765 [Aquificales bacterium]|nr:hypothetical protein [Aquificales bacterium]
MTQNSDSNPLSNPPAAYVHLLFLDGVGLGVADPEVNPFATAVLPHLSALFGKNWYVRGQDPIITDRASLIPTDANLGMPSRPQSATGQAAILTGRNVPELVGEHYGPKPNQPVRDVIQAGSLFQEVVDAGGQAALITPYPQGFFEAIDSGKRLLSSVPLAATSAGLALMTADDLRNGRAVSPDFTAQGWRDYFGDTRIPLLTLPEAGKRIAHIARHYHFSFFEHWPSDMRGHRGSLDEAVTHLETIDAVIGGLLSVWDDEHGLLIITSDHGNIENKSHRKHTRNRVPTILIGKNHAQLAPHIQDLTDIAPVVRLALSLGV